MKYTISPFQKAVTCITNKNQAKDLMCWYCFYKLKLPLVDFTHKVNWLVKALCKTHGVADDLRYCETWLFALSKLESYEPELLKKVALNERSLPHELI